LLATTVSEKNGSRRSGQNFTGSILPVLQSFVKRGSGRAGCNLFLFAFRIRFAEVWCIDSHGVTEEWDEFAKTTIAWTAAICRWVEFCFGPERFRHRGTDTHTANHPTGSGGEGCEERVVWRNGYGKSGRNRRVILSSS